MDELRRFAALRRRLVALEQECYTLSRVMDVTDWRGAEHGFELQAHTAKLVTVEDEMADIEYLLSHYERSVAASKAMIVTPKTVLFIAALVLVMFVLMTVTAGLFAGAFRGG
jgi:hypothetical protein